MHPPRGVARYRHLPDVDGEQLRDLDLAGVGDGAGGDRLVRHLVRIDELPMHPAAAGLAYLRATLLPHESTVDGWDFETCGTTADRWPCVAWSVSGDRQCPKNAAVRLPAQWLTPGTPGAGETFGVHVCGGHFDVHRLGKPLGIVV